MSYAVIVCVEQYFRLSTLILTKFKYLFQVSVSDFFLQLDSVRGTLTVGKRDTKEYCGQLCLFQM